MPYEKIHVDKNRAIISGLSTETKPTTLPDRSLAFETDTGDVYRLLNGTWRYVAVNGSTLVIMHEAVPRLPVSPTISGVSAGELLVDCDSGTIEEVRFIINPGNDNEAADALANGISGAFTVFPDRERAVPSGEPITDVYAIVIGNGGTDSGGDNIVDSSSVKNINGQLATTVGTVAMMDVTAAELIASTHMIHWEFSEDDDVRLLDVNLGQRFDSSTQMRISVGGRSFDE